MVVVLEVVQALAVNDDNCPALVNAVPGIVGAMERHPDHVELVTTAMTAMKNMMTGDGRAGSYEMCWGAWWFGCPLWIHSCLGLTPHASEELRVYVYSIHGGDAG